MSAQLSGLPFSGPIGGVRVALIRGQWVAFPNHSELEGPCSTWSLLVVSSAMTSRHDGQLGHRQDNRSSSQAEQQLPSEEIVAQGLGSIEEVHR